MWLWDSHFFQLPHLLILHPFNRNYLQLLPKGHDPGPTHWHTALEPPWTCWWGQVDMEHGGAYLLLSEVQSGGEQTPLHAHHILLPRKLLLQPGQLVAGEDGPDSLGFAGLGFDDREAALGDQEAWR